MPRIEIGDVVTGLGLLGNVLSLPRQVQAQQMGNEQTRMLLKDSGLPPEMIAAATPEPMLRWLSPQQGGFMGHVLGGVGDVGSILSTVVGKPVKAPRMELSDLASASKLRAAHAAELAKERLGKVILDPKSTKRDIAAASVAAGDTDQALRMLRGDGEGRPPASILGLRSAIEAMDPDDPRRPQYQRALDDQLEYQRQQQEDEDRRIRERQPPHYTPEEIQQRRHAEIMKERRDEALKRYKEGTPEFQYFMDYGHPRLERQPPPPTTLDQEIDKETRRRTNLLGKPGQPKRLEDFPEPVETTARRNLANRQKAAAAEKSGEPLPPPPPPPQKRGAAAGGLVGATLGGTPSETSPTTITPSSTPTTTTTSTTQPPSDDVLGADFDSLPPEIQQQITAAAKAGMPDQEIANWLLYLRQPKPQAQPRP
jgi:hypothetical protein